MYLAIGLPFGVLVTFFASKAQSLAAGLPICLLAVLIVWITLFLGVTQGYDAWQALPNPPEKAFADGAKLIGVRQRIESMTRQPKFAYSSLDGLDPLPGNFACYIFAWNPIT